MNGSSPPPTVATWWIVWFSILAGIPMFAFFLKPPGAAGLDSSLWPVALLPFVMATVIRWAVLPRLGTVQTVFAVFIAGMAMAETCCFLGIFLFPGARYELITAGSLGVLQFVPLFAARYYR